MGKSVILLPELERQMQSRIAELNGLIEFRLRADGTCKLGDMYQLGLRKAQIKWKTSPWPTPPL
jgi:hypothetical protein